MKTKLFGLLIGLVTFLGGCSSSETDNPPNSSEDLTPPSITISQIAEEIESSTPLNISINDNSESVTTIISINGIQVFSSNQKQFTFDIDPFDYPTGETTIQIVSTDANNNVSEDTFTTELKKLLYRQEFGYSSSSFDSFIAINRLDSGELIAFRKMSTIDDSSYYASDDFESGNLIITNYLISKTNNFHSANSFGNVQPVTVRLRPNEIRDAIGIDLVSVNKNNTLSLTVQNTPLFHRYSTLGYFYSFGNTSDPTISIDYDSQNTSSIFLAYREIDNANLATEFRYLYLDEITDRTLDFSELSSLTEDQVKTFILPENTVDFSFASFGFNSEYEYLNQHLNLIYSYSGETNSVGNTFNYPLLPYYDILTYNISLSLSDGRRIQLETDDISTLNLPEISYQQINDEIEIEGLYDFSQLILESRISSGGDDIVFRRNYKDLYKSNLNNPFVTLELPKEIIDTLNNLGFNLSAIDPNGDYALSLRLFEDKVAFPNEVFYNRYANESGDVSTVRFPLENFN